MKIGSVVIEIFGEISRFLPYRFKSTNFSHLNLWRYWTKVDHICRPTWCGGIICAIHLLIHIAIFNFVLKCQSAEWKSLCKFCPKSVAMVTSLEKSKNWPGLTTFTQIPSIWWKKNHENRSSRSWDSFAAFKKRKKLQKVNYIARSASLPSGLKTPRFAIERIQQISNENSFTRVAFTTFV